MFLSLNKLECLILEASWEMINFHSSQLMKRKAYEAFWRNRWGIDGFSAAFYHLNVNLKLHGCWEIFDVKSYLILFTDFFYNENHKLEMFFSNFVRIKKKKKEGSKIESDPLLSLEDERWQKLINFSKWF